MIFFTRREQTIVVCLLQVLKIRRGCGAPFRRYGAAKKVGASNAPRPPVSRGIMGEICIINIFSFSGFLIPEHQGENNSSSWYPNWRQTGPASHAAENLIVGMSPCPSPNPWPGNGILQVLIWSVSPSAVSALPPVLLPATGSDYRIVTYPTIGG